MDSNPSQVKTKDYKIVVIILAWNGVEYGFKPQSGKNPRITYYNFIVLGFYLTGV
jgi:hypothetical protein